MRWPTKLFVLSGLYAVSASYPGLAAPTETEPLAPTSPWRIDYAEVECRLIRTFGAGDSLITLRIARGGTSDAFDTVVAGPGIPRLPQQVEVTFGLDPQGVKQTLGGYSLAVPNTKDRFIRWYDADASLFSNYQSEQVMRIAVGERYQVRLRLTEAVTALQAMDACYADLLKGWGIDPAQVFGLAVRPIPIGRSGGSVTAMRSGDKRPTGPAGWITYLDYPTDALRQEIGGTVFTALQIGVTGQVEKCRVVISSKSKLLDDQTCTLLTARARYSPAQDRDGKPVPATTMMRVRWSIPD